MTSVGGRTYENKSISVLVRGDREASEEKIKKYMNYESFLEMGDEKTIFNATGADRGFAGPIGIKIDKMLIDEEVLGINNFIVGGNQTDYHYVNVNLKRDFDGEIGDFKNIAEGDLCPICGAVLKEQTVLEIGNMYNGLKDDDFIYDDDSNVKNVIVNSYSIGIFRLMGVIAENNKDDRGIVWPNGIASFSTSVIVAVAQNNAQMNKAQEIYNILSSKGISVIFDDRDVRVGVKFKDCDLLGIPFKIIVGKKANECIVEFKKRSEKNFMTLTIDECINEIVKMSKVNK